MRDRYKEKVICVCGEILGEIHLGRSPLTADVDIEVLYQLKEKVLSHCKEKHKGIYEQMKLKVMN